MTPIILISGPAGSGKNTVADFLVKDHNAISIALADPMKRLAKQIFEFTDLQLWGPSECRNMPEDRFKDNQEWILAHDNLLLIMKDWCNDMFGGGKQSEFAMLRLTQWFADLPRGAITPRLVLQTMGTEFGRNIARDMWIDYGLHVAMSLLGGGYSYDPTKGLSYAKPEHRSNPDWVAISDGRFRNELVKVLAVGGHTWKIIPKTIEEVSGGVPGHTSESEMRGIPDNFYSSIVKNDKSKGLVHCEAVVESLVARIQTRGKIQVRKGQS